MDHPFRIGDRVRRAGRGDTTPTGTIEATHYGHARPTVDVYWGTRADSGHGPIREITTEAPETLELCPHAALSPDEVLRRHAAAVGGRLEYDDTPLVPPAPPVPPADQAALEDLLAGDYAPADNPARELP